MKTIYNCLNSACFICHYVWLSSSTYSVAVSDVPSVLQVVLPLCIVGLGTGNAVLGDFKNITFHDGVLINATSGIVCVSSIA